MSDTHRQLRHRTDHERKERTEEDHGLPERNWRRKFGKWAFNGMEIAAGRRSILGRPRILRRPSRDRHRRDEHDRRRRRRTKSPSKGRHRSPDKSRRERSDVPNHPWPHEHPPDISKPTEPTLSRSRASYHAVVVSGKDLGGIRVDAHTLQHRGSDHINTPSHLDDDHHSLSGHVGSDLSDSGDGYDSDVSEASSCLDTNHKKGIDIAIPSTLDDGRNSDVNNPLSGPEPDNNKDLVVDTPSGLEELTASPRGIPPHSQQVPTTALKFGTLDVADDDYDGLPSDASSGPSDLGGSHSGNLNRGLSGLETDHNEDLDDAPLSSSDEDTTVDSDEYSVDQADTPPSSHETSGRDDDEDSDSESWTSDSSEDQEEDVCQATASLLQVAKTDHGDTFSKSGENRDVPLSSGPLHPSEDHEAEDTPNAVIRLQHIVDADSGDISSDSEGTSSDTEDASSDSEDTSSGPKDTPDVVTRLQQTADADSNNTSSGREDTPSESQDISSCSEGMSCDSEDTSSESEDEDVSSGSEDISSDSEDTPSNSEATPPDSEDACAESEDEDISSDSSDTSSDTEDTSSGSEGTSSDSEDTPSNYGDTPSHSEDTLSDSEDASSESEDEDLATGDSDGSIDDSSENEDEVDDSLGQDEDYTHILPQPSPEKQEKASTIVPVSPVNPAGLVDPSPPQWNVTGSEDSMPEVSPSHNASETESPSPPQSSSPLVLPVYLYPGSIVRRRSKDDHHPYIIIRIEQYENGKPILWACLCTSRPQLEKLRRQYGKRQRGKRQHRKLKRWKKHFIYLGGKEVNPKGFETDGLPMPTKPEVEIQGPLMPLFTFLELDEYGPFEPEDFEIFSDDSDDSDDQRHLTLSSLNKVLKQCKQHGLRKRPIQVGRKKKLKRYGRKKRPNRHGCKKSPPGSVPARATGNTHERIFT
ncbi:hypothetical protein CEP51_013929 [Fusarium floridanum]|uniref:Uncharacterized protein n=1 Tax=Fusarium floridanum TaxID=1325733 RepID=A0A428Q287_9HYPO|nr:hypothetical protein CEP51_013929 [Fusarium floridanum]